jgi:hypothetical protein
LLLLLLLLLLLEVLPLPAEKSLVVLGAGDDALLGEVEVEVEVEFDISLRERITKRTNH